MGTKETSPLALALRVVRGAMIVYYEVIRNAFPSEAGGMVSGAYILSRSSHVDPPASPTKPPIRRLLNRDHEEDGGPEERGSILL